jgi:hypothetical protein
MKKNMIANNRRQKDVIQDEHFTGGMKRHVGCKVPRELSRVTRLGIPERWNLPPHTLCESGGIYSDDVKDLLPCRRFCIILRISIYLT